MATPLAEYRFERLGTADIDELCRRPHIDFQHLFEQVTPIIEAVDEEGDLALRRYTQIWDKAQLNEVCIPVPQEVPSLDPSLRDAIDRAYQNIRHFHEKQLSDPEAVETMPGVKCHRLSRPIERVGLYVPGGTAILPSTALMLGVPAQLAGCREIVLASPPRPDGRLPAEIIYIAQRCGVTQLLLAGGAQAIAAMALGTETVPKVDKILGPGNQYVTAAKMLLQNSEAMIAIDMPAGPSEVLVIADASARPDWVAADLLSQAEHGSDSQVVLVTVGDWHTEAVLECLEAQLTSLPRAELARKALEHSYLLKCATYDQAMYFSNQYAPEHLILQTSNADLLVEQVINAGSVFVGHLSPESVGDYASGTNHTLPTYGYARMYSGVSVDSFLKRITVQTLTENGLRSLGPHVIRLAEAEGLHAHARAVQIRLDHLI